jgi:bifunctional non-homologous end joining protein LigD
MKWVEATEKGMTWVEPTMVAEVEYSEWTDEGLLRQPVFLRFRDDKRPEECVRDPRAKGRAVSGDESEDVIPRERERPRDLAGQASEPAGKIPPPRSARARDDSAGEPLFELTNLKKVFWPEEGYTKGDLTDYYREVSPWLLAYLRNRPLVMTRYPDGIGGKSFFQKDAPGFRPGWIRTERMWSEDTQREIDYFVCDDEASLLYVVNLGTIPLHLWASRVPTLERPDWCVLDLDPKGAPFDHVVEVAREAKKLCDRIGLPVLVKSTGSSGLHLMIPLGRQCTHEQSRSLGELLARCLVERLPKIATIVRQVTQREGKVYVDYLQNGSGKLIVAPFSVRPLPGAPVSVPLAWREVNRKLDIRRHTIKTVPERMRKLESDPLAEVLELSPDLGAALERLMEELR